MQKQVPRVKPSQRPKKRYVLFSLECGKNFSFSELSKQLWFAIVARLGKEEALCLGFQLMVFDFAKRKGIFKCRREECEKAKKAVNSISMVGNEKSSMKSLRTSGTASTLKEILAKQKDF